MIRKIKESDRETFLDMIRAFYQSPAVLHPVDETNFEKTFTAAVNHSPYVDIYMIEDEGFAAGYCQVSLSWSNEAGGLVVWIEEIYIKDSFQGRGLGGQCLDFIKETYQEASRFRLEISSDNEGAKRLYQRKGYEVLDYIQMIWNR